MELTNKDYYKVHGDGIVTVTLEFACDPKLKQRDILINAAEAIKFYADNNYHKSWTKRLGIEWAVGRVRSRKEST
jgi:hypothetical protein